MREAKPRAWVRKRLRSSRCALARRMHAIAHGLPRASMIFFAPADAGSFARDYSLAPPRATHASFLHPSIKKVRVYLCHSARLALCVHDIFCARKEAQASRDRYAQQQNTNHPPNTLNITQKNGGNGIRTRERITPQHAFQACALNHSAIPPS